MSKGLHSLLSSSLNPLVAASDINSALHSYGERDEARPNLIARLPGQGSAPPLLLQGHVDVVTTEKQTWQHPPFEGKVVDGYDGISLPTARKTRAFPYREMRY